MQNYEQKGKEQRAMGEDKMKKQALSSFLLGLLRSLQGSLGELGKNKAGLVDLRVVVTAQLGLLVLGPLAKGLLDVGVGILGADHESDLAAGVGGDGGETVLDSGEQLAGEAHDLLDNGHVKPDALALGANDSSGMKSVLHQLKELGLEERGSRANGIGGVSDDDIEAVDLVLEESESVSNVDLDLGVLKSSSHRGQVLLGNADNSLVNLAEGDLLNTLVLDNLTQDTTIASSDDQDLLGVRMGVHGDVGHHLLVGEFIALSGLDDSVEDEDVAVGGRLEDEDVLEEGLLDVEDLLNLEGHGLAGPESAGFLEPAILDEGVSKSFASMQVSG